VSDPDAMDVSWDYRRRTIVASESLLRILHTAVDVYDGDLEDFVIYLSITVASVGALVRNAELAAAPPKGRVPVRYYRGVSRRAIAASTGLPRETVRRKIAAFIEQGRLIEHGAYVRVPQGLLEQDDHRAFAHTLVSEFVCGAAQIARIPE